MESLETDLRARFAVVESRIDVAGREFALLRPRSADELINEDEFNVDERLPYWAEIWPSARVLADRIATWPSRGRRLLELGCGCGFVAMVAGRAGFDVLATDYYEPACQFVELNAARHELSNVQTRLVNWRELPEDLGQFDVVLAADVLYEREYCRLVANVISRTLTPGGISVVTDPGRQRAETFLDECAAVGLAGKRAAQVPYDDGMLKPTVDVYELRWPEDEP
jgi:predicted nicotinamide N-methyase